MPPVSREDDNHVLDKPHVFLDEIMRQAQDSEIIRLSMHVREGRPLGSFQSAGQQVQIYSPREVVTGMYDWADQVLCATNRTRTNINNEMRARKGFDPNLPNPSDKVISLRNHWECYSNKLSALTNGTIGNITQFTKETIRFPYKYHLPPTEVLNTTIHTEDDEEFENLQIDYKHLITGEPTFDSKQLYKLLKDKGEPPYEFAYAYAITTHKAQGSEWDKIMLVEESFPFSPEEHRRWLYTGITRAKEKLVLIKK